MIKLIKLLKIIPYYWIIMLMHILNKYTSRLYMLSNAMSFVGASNLKGDYLEFGVFEGKTFIGAYHNALMYNQKEMNFYAFDSFKGLPDSIEYKNPNNPFYVGLYAFSLDKFKGNLKKAKVDFSKVQIIPGWYSQTLNNKTKEKLPLTKAAIVWIDCDLYESTVPVLEFVTEYLGNGSLLIFDDWYLFAGNSSNGEQRATKEWLQKHPEMKLIEYRKFGAVGLSFIVEIIKV